MLRFDGSRGQGVTAKYSILMLCFQSSTSFTSSWDPPAQEQTSKFRCLLCTHLSFISDQGFMRLFDCWGEQRNLTTICFSWSHSPLQMREVLLALKRLVKSSQFFRCTCTTYIREGNWNSEEVLTFATGSLLHSLIFISKKIVLHR